jgi:mannose-6-phosphate isomerase-like protein (cupin superfamily)
VTFASKRLQSDVDAIAPDGSDVRVLLGLSGGGMAHFQLAPGQTSIGVHHRTVDEIWYVVTGNGEMWLSDGSVAESISVRPGCCVSIPVGTHFQFRNVGAEPLAAVGVTMPPWPGDGEAIRSRLAPWEPTVPAGPGLAEE